MIIFHILQNLSLREGEKLLLEEGYHMEKCIEKDDTSCDKLFLYPYCLYDRHGKILDCIYYAEFCNAVIDDEYIDGRMTWQSVKANWTR